MSRTFLFIQGIYDTIDLFISAFAQAFECLGHTAYVIDIREKNRAMDELKKIIEEEKPDAVITFNNIGYNLSFSEGEVIWEKQEIPFINILMDHPFHYAAPLRQAPSTSVIFCTDRNHVQFLKRFYPHLEKVDFMPHAGMEADITCHADAGRCYLTCPTPKKDRHGTLPAYANTMHPPIAERSIDVLYAGGLSKYVAEGLVPDLGEIKEFDAFALTQEVLAELMQSPEKTTEEVIEAYLLSIGKQYTDEELNHWITELRFIDSYATSFYREQSVQLLVENGIKVTVFGGGWDRCEWAEHPNFLYGGKVLAPQVLELMNHSKIVLNTMTWYKNGIHDRIINGMLAKSVVLTDTSVYLEEQLQGKAQGALQTFTLPQIWQLPEIAGRLLKDEENMQKIADCGYIYARSHHTWLQRAETILDKVFGQ